jgi:hypothetical protein
VGRKYGFRSGLEERTAAELDTLGVKFTFEQQKVEYIKPARQAKYTPDFIITHRPDGTPRDRPLVVETKGRFLTDDRQKHLLIRDQHPELDIRFVFSNPNQRISKTSKTTYAVWCEKHGFQFAKERIPKAWLEE